MGKGLGRKDSPGSLVDEDRRCRGRYRIRYRDRQGAVRGALLDERDSCMGVDALDEAAEAEEPWQIRFGRLDVDIALVARRAVAVARIGSVPVVRRVDEDVDLPRGRSPELVVVRL